MPRKVCVTLMGMSGVGKSHFSKMLAEWGWQRYSCDEEIGKVLLNDHSGDISFLTELLGKLGDPAKGGYALEDFKKRQKMYGDAEAAVTLAMGEAAAKADQNFVYDSSGSLCELEDPAVMKHIDENSRVVYIRATPEHEKAVLARALTSPKPIFYPPSRFDSWVKQYLHEQGLSSAEEMDPTAFFTWVFPILFKERLPKYEMMSQKYGISISSEDLMKVKNEEEFLELIDSAAYAHG